MSPGPRSGNTTVLQLRTYDPDPADDFRFHAPHIMKPDRLTFLRIRWFCTNREPALNRNLPILAPPSCRCIRKGMGTGKNPGSEFLVFL
ncbi:MAG: hypothetical protein CVV32_06985 [Methanomicrobiales archaeon HGW-Methanomicrobiales-3]|nr:MAG: hypothetical protein CVV32_06985 [Methanomicrobiales archaeon HGW-Methanomicrobiales-3]